MSTEATPERLRAQVAELTAQLEGRPLDAELDAWLNREHGVGRDTYRALKASLAARDALIASRCWATLKASGGGGTAAFISWLHVYGRLALTAS